ncbi:hypothetical protein CKO27_16380 [Thiocystis violacea]|nr:hypothetical protein [Thiocystis violacea]
MQEVREALKRMADNTPRVVARVINDVAFKVMAAERALIASSFDRPKPFVAKNVRVFKATAEKLSATVGATDWFERGGMQAKGTAWDRLLAPHVYGGQRLQKASERRLQAAGLLPRGWLTVPGQGAKLDRYGNMSGGEIVAILSWVGAMNQYAGDNLNKRDRLTKRKNKTEAKGAGYFVARVGNAQRLAPGIYQRTAPFPSKSRGAPQGRGLKPVLMFVSQARYQTRLDWHGVGQRVVAQEFPPAFVRAAEGLLS